MDQIKIQSCIIKSGIIVIIILLTFILIFSGTKLTIKAASSLCYSWIILMLIVSQLGILYGILNKNDNKQIYILEISILISIALVYVLYIKHIYDIENKIIEELREKNIIYL
jgi:hypothetical protein